MQFSCDKIKELTSGCLFTSYRFVEALLSDFKNNLTKKITANEAGHFFLGFLFQDISKGRIVYKSYDCVLTEQCERF